MSMNFLETGRNFFFRRSWNSVEHSGPSCSTLTTSLVNDSLKFTLNDTQICGNFLLKICE